MYFVLQQKQQDLPEKKWGNYKLIKSFSSKPKQAFLQKIWHIWNNQNNNQSKHFCDLVIWARFESYTMYFVHNAKWRNFSKVTAMRRHVYEKSFLLRTLINHDSGNQSSG